MLVQSYNFPLKYDIVLVASGKLLGDSITLIGYTTIGSVLLFHNNTTSFLNIKREFKSLDVSQQCLVMASENTLTVHDIDNNFDQCYKELPDGINTLAVGPYFDGYVVHDLIFVGGNCSIQGFNNQGEEVYWNVASDEVVCLYVFGQEKEYYIAVGTADNCIRLLRGEEIVFQYNTQSLPVCFSGLIYFDQAHLVTALDNGQLTLYRSNIQEWKNSEEEDKIFKIICCDENHLIVGRKNGNIELRQLLSGQLLQKLNIDETITGMVYTDLRGVRVNQIVVVTRSGNVRGITIVDKEENTKSLSDQLAELQQKKQELTQQLTMDTLPVGLRIFCGYTKNASNQSIDLVFQIKEQGYYITQAIIFHDTYFKDGYVVTTSQPSDQLFAPLKQLVDNQKVELNCKVFVTSNPYGNFFQVLEAKPTFKKFSNFFHTEQEQQITSFVEAKIKERVPRYVKWIDQCFVVQENITKQFESQSEFIFNAVNVINKQKLQIHFNSNEGKVIVRCDSIAVCGDIIQDLCDFIQLSELMTIGQFPIEMAEFKQVLERVQQHKASKLQISGDVAEAMNLVKSYIVKAEDSRMIGDVATMQKMYANVMVQNRAIQGEIYKKQQNNEILMNSLKEVNSMINKASQLRVGNSKATITTMCRNAVKKNNLLSLIEVIQSGREI